MKIELKPDLLQCLKFITNICYEGNITTDKEGIHILERAEGGHLGIIFDYKVKGLKDDIFRCDFMKLNKIIRAIKGDKAIMEIVEGQIRIAIKGDNLDREFFLAMLVPEPLDEEMFKAKGYAYKINFPLLVDILGKIVDESSLFNETFYFITTAGDSKLIILADEHEGKGYKAEIDIGKKMKEGAKARYSIDYIKRITKDGGFTLVDVGYDTDFPMRMLVEEENYTFNFIIAPRISD